VRVDVRVEQAADGWVAVVDVEQGGKRTKHRVTVSSEDLARYGAVDPADLVRRSFEFLLQREPNTSILREFGVTEIERYFPEFPASIRRP
jgi:hypothetical protein